MSAILCRRGDAADVPAIIALHRRAILTNGRRAYSEAECESWAAGLVPARYVEAMEGGELFEVAVEDARVVGFCSRKDDEVIGLYVDPAAGGRGIGGTLLARAEAAIADAGHATVRIKAALSGLSFYERRGYRPVEHLSWTTRGGLVIPTVLVTKATSPA